MAAKRTAKNVKSPMLDPRLYPEPSDAERDLMRDAGERKQGRRARVAVQMSRNEDGKPSNVSPEHNDVRGWLLRLADAMGTPSDDFSVAQLNKLIRMAGIKGDSVSVNAMLAAIDGTRPRDEMEAMLAVQMAATHALAMECLIRANRADTVPALDANGNLATKMLRTYVAQVEALAKLRRGGEQTVRVEHVHVHPGGQAIVGSVRHGGGGDRKSDEQPYGPPNDTRALAFAPGSPLWRENEVGEAVPLPRDEGEAQMPHTRRRSR